MLAQVLTVIILAAPAALAKPPSPNLGTPPPPTVADPLKGLDLWRGAKVGMSESDVRRLFPNARPPAVLTTLTGGQMDRLELEPVELVGRLGTAHFYFAGTELESVELTVSGFTSSQRTRNMDLARSITKNYSTTYGQGYDCGDRSLADIDLYECKWLKGKLSVQLMYMDVAGQAPLFYIAYRQSDDPSYNL